MRKYLLVLIALFLISCNKSTFNETGKKLGIQIPADSKIEKENTIALGQDYQKELTFSFSEKGSLEIIKEIEKSTYFNLQYTFYGSNESVEAKNDTVIYWKVRDYLEKNHLTGYWMKKNDSTYQFYEPALSDIPNSAILFHEAFVIEATLSLKDKLLIYKYFKL